MEFLRLMGVGADGSALILVGTEGKQFRLVVDDALRTAVRSARILPPAAHHNTLALPPREIQARLRAGATAETVAQDSGIPVEKVRRYETPILAERAHVATLAQAALVRRPASGTAGTGARTLGEILSAYIEPFGYQGDALQWDAWRRPDGRWTVQVGMPQAPEQPCTWTFEPPTRAVSPSNDMAREVLAEPSPVAEPTLSSAPRSNVHELSLLREVELPARRPASAPRASKPAAATGAKASSRKRKPAVTPPAALTLDLREETAAVAVGQTSRPAKPSAAKSGKSSRARVPAWDDILFGGSN